MRKIITFILCLSLLFSVLPISASANAKIDSEEVILLEKQTEIVEDGQVVGNSFKTITRKIENETIYLEVNELKQYNDGRIIENSEITTIKIVDENVAIINGEKVNLSQEEFSFEEQMTPLYTVLNSGGRYSYTTWEERFDSNFPPSPYMTVMKSASGIQNRAVEPKAMFLDSGGAKNDEISRTVFTPTSSINELKIINFKSYAADVVLARNTINISVPLLMVALGVTVLTAATVILALSSAGSAASLAASIWNAGSEANSAMESAYAILNTL